KRSPDGRRPKSAVPSEPPGNEPSEDCATPPPMLPRKRKGPSERNDEKPERSGTNGSSFKKRHYTVPITTPWARKDSHTSVNCWGSRSAIEILHRRKSRIAGGSMTS